MIELEQIINDLDRLSEEIGSLRFKERLERIRAEIKEENKTPDWGAIAGNGFLVGCSNFGHKTAQGLANQGFLGIYEDYEDGEYPFRTNDGVYKNIAFPELPGIRRPGFGKRPEWLIHTDRIMVKFEYAEEYSPTAFTVGEIDWNHVEEFILL